MADIQAFQERLSDVLTLARTNGKKITREGIDYFFAEEGPESRTDGKCI